MKLKTMKNKTGQVVGSTIQNLLTASVGLLVLAGVLVGISAFGSTQEVAGKCDGVNRTLCNAAWNLTANVESMTNKFGAQLGTVGVMFGVGLIIAAIAVLGVGMMNNR